jgi:hypothetical protein
MRSAGSSGPRKQEEYTMKLKFDAGAALAVLTLAVTLAATLVLPAYAQKPAAPASALVNTETGSMVTRTPMKMDSREFLRTHEWNEATDTWSMKMDVMPPEGVKSRAEVKAQRDTFLSNNRWDNVTSQYVAIKPGPRQLSSLTRAQVKAETVQFMRTHSWNEETSTWVDVPARKAKM